LKSSLSWNGVACKPICNPIVSNRLSILMHFALGHLLQTLHCPHPRAMLTALQLAETFCTAAEYSTLHVRRTGCVWTCPRIRAHFFNSTRILLRFWGHLSSLKYAEIITEFLDMIFLSNFCGILWYFVVFWLLEILVQKFCRILGQSHHSLRSADIFGQKPQLSDATLSS
jgi:hypothetical protein